MVYDPSQLNDDQLLAVELRTDDPSAIENLSTKRPVLDGPPTILMEYHLPSSGAPVRCCYCDTKTHHRNGFVIEAAFGRRHLIGSSCGPKYLGLSFGHAHRTFKSFVSRQSLLRRIAAMQPTLPAMLSYRPAGPKLQAVLQAEAAFQKGANDLYMELRQLAWKGLQLSETVTVRDYEAEQRSESDEPRYRTENQAIGVIEGAALLRARTLYDTLDARQKTVAAFVRTIADGTDQLSERQLRTLLDTLEDADQKARDAIGALNRAHTFFSETNFQRIERSNVRSSKQLPTLSDGKFGFPTRMGDVAWHPIPAPPNAAAPPRLATLKISPDRSK